jgi:hypothetical protein
MDKATSVSIIIPYRQTLVEFFDPISGGAVFDWDRGG